MSPALKKAAGIGLIVLGVILHLIPLFPAGWIIILGLELAGIRLFLIDRIRGFYKGIGKRR